MQQFFVQIGWCLPLYGLFGAIATIPWAAAGSVRSSGPRLGAYINVLLSLLACIHGGAILQAIWNTDGFSILVPWLQVVNLDLSFALEISPVTVGAAEFVAGLSLLAQVYALGYMEKDWAIARFFALLGFFEAAIIALALSDSLLLSYALLELLTLSTYLLVGFWYAQPLGMNAARDAFWTKRVGDLFLLMGVVALSELAGSLNFSDLATWSQTAQLSPLTATLLGLALIAGPTGKCAQFPLHLWLDEAMEGPNPASILRNSVVVTSGAYVLIKLDPVLGLSPIASTVLVALGIGTAVGASLVAIAQVDIKRALSHTTSAYLGLVFVAVGLQSTDAALMLLLAHGIAKALLFMSCGSVIFTTHTQDLTELGGLGGRMPATSTAFLVGTAGMLAVLPLGCFWAMVHWIEVIGLIRPALVVVPIAVNGLTAFNLVRVYSLVFGGQTQPKTRRAPEVAWPMAVPQVVAIALTSILPIAILQRRDVIVDLQLLPWRTVGVMIASGVAGASLSAAIYLGRLWPKPVRLPMPALQSLLSYGFYVDRLYRSTIVFAVSKLSKASIWLDRYIIDGAVNFVGLATVFGGESLKYSSPGKSQIYLLTILVALGLLGVLVSWLPIHGGL
ncbi:NAD(P)H-quinone oxidoreductase subunit F [Synechococcus sp. PCC 7336]|uniref:NAD(P)H-quinone oxidoreductase subunit F n=1 Tax=Synechococcus sp. PCC 7336 TaxID=195250 RepID=UPI000349F1EE|nr:NAD(P)H-quinone oxidoreductase subunit F [Synechococcus sp. PCC 7336]